MNQIVIADPADVIAAREDILDLVCPERKAQQVARLWLDISPAAREKYQAEYKAFWSRRPAAFRETPSQFFRRLHHEALTGGSCRDWKRTPQA